MESTLAGAYPQYSKILHLRGDPKFVKDILRSYSESKNGTPFPLPKLDFFGDLLSCGFL